MRSLLAIVLATALIQTGCFILDKPCDGDAVPEPTLGQGFLNPETGTCQFFGGGGGGGTCGDFGGPAIGAADIAIPDWALCFSECTGLDEASCQAKSGCRAAYVSNCPEGARCPEVTYSYTECWQVAPSGPIQGGTCTDLDSQECSRHDDCVAQHYPPAGAPLPAATDGVQYKVPVALPAVGRFESCAPEAITPPPLACFGQPVCDSLPPACPPSTLPAIAGACWSGDCIPVDQCEPAPSCEIVPSEAACITQTKCAPIYAGSNCSCDANGQCTCQSVVYQRCQNT